ncbi:hypothetical protein Tco_0988360 [Tanacetum coccineum]|uniref:Uncharacterized protein n=1 Tax=Tanacetum coccineum TaxID=301880 RepID=A0ABQ5EQS2_9ASTR
MDLGYHSISGNRIGKNRKMSPRGSCVWDVKMSERSKSKTTRRRSFNLAKLVVKRRRKRSPLDSNCDVLLDEYKVEHVCNASSDGGRDTKPPSERLAICATLVMNEEMERVAIIELVTRKGKVGWLMEIISKEKPCVIGLRETKSNDVEEQ